MKKTISMMFALGTSLLLLGACTSSQPNLDTIKTIEDATEKNESIENARFKTIKSIVIESEESHQESEGAFIKNSDWYHKTTIQTGEDSNTTEMVEIDGNHYQKNTINQTNSTGWLELPNSGETIKNYVSSLFENDLVASEIADTQVTEKESTTHYKLTLNKEYSDRVKNGNLEALKLTIEESKQNDTDDLIVQSLENQLKYIEETNYKDSSITYGISPSGYLTSVSFELTVSPPDEAPFTLVSSHQLIDYNSKSTEGFIPEIVN